MQRGMYSVIRYTNDLNDQRVNLGVLVWHPVDGFCIRVAPTLSRVQAVNSTADLDDVDGQLGDIKQEISTHARVRSDLLELLSRRYREGLAVSAPYPARMYSASATADRLYEMLVTQKGAAKPRHEKFEESVKNTIKGLVHEEASGLQCREHGRQKVNGVSVPIGIEVWRGQKHSLWRSFALHFHQGKNAQMDKVKAAAMDVVTIRNEVPSYRDYAHFVAVQALNASDDQWQQAESWLRHANAEPVIIAVPEQLAGKIGEKLATL